MKSISLHPMHGVNPTLGLCFWCGEGDGTIGLLGFNKNKKAPREAVLTLEPCDKCKVNISKGVMVIEATDYQLDKWQVQIQRDAYPTGRWCVVKRDAAFWDVIKEPMRTLVLEQGKMFLLPELYEGLGFADVGNVAAAS